MQYVDWVPVVDGDAGGESLDLPVLDTENTLQEVDEYFFAACSDKYDRRRVRSAVLKRGLPGSSLELIGDQGRYVAGAHEIGVLS